MNKNRQRQLPAYLSQWVGKFAIRVSAAWLHRRPDVVFITHVTRHGYLAGQVLNQDELLLAKPHQLTEFTPRVYAALHSQYRLREAKATLAHEAGRLGRAATPCRRDA